MISWSRVAQALTVSAYCAAVSMPGFVVAAEWKPDRVVEIIVATGAGGGQDRSARTVQRILQDSKILSVTSTVQNRPGGGGLVAWSGSVRNSVCEAGVQC